GRPHAGGLLRDRAERRMKIAYLAEDTAMSGGIRVQLAHADALIARGHRVRIVTKGAPVTWRRSDAEFVYVDNFHDYDARDDEFYRERIPPENEPPRVLLSGQSQADLKGIEEGYGAVAHARWFHQKLELVRVSPWAPSREEPLDSVDEFHVALTTAEMTRLMHSCDV